MPGFLVALDDQVEDKISDLLARLHQESDRRAWLIRTCGDAFYVHGTEAASDADIAVRRVDMDDMSVVVFAVWGCDADGVVCYVASGDGPPARDRDLTERIRSAEPG